MPQILRKLPLLYKPALAVAIASMCTVPGSAQVSCMITYRCATGSCGGFGTITKGPGQFASPQACQSAASANNAGMAATCSCTGGGSFPGPVNRGPSLAEIRRMQEEQAALEAAAEAERRYSAAVKVEQDAEANNLASRADAAATAESARLEFLRERDKLAGALRDGPAITLTLHGDGASSLGLREDTPASAVPSQPVKVSKWGREPPLPSSIGRTLSSNISSSVDPAAASDYIGRALDFIREDTLKTANSAVRKSALSGEMFAEAEMGPYGMATVVMMNVATLPQYVFKQVSSAISGGLPPGDAEGLGMTVRSVNHIFDLGSPVNSAIENGASQTLSGEVTSQAKQSLATLAASFLPVQDEVKQSIASQATHIADTATAAYRHIFTSDPETP